MIIQQQIDYAAGTHKSDSQNLPHPVKAIRVRNTSGSDVVLSCFDGKNSFTLEFPDGYVGWEPSTIHRINSTGTTGDTATGVKINLGLQ